MTRRFFFLQKTFLIPLAGLVWMILAAPPVQSAEPTPEEVRKALHKAVQFFRQDVAGDTGGYLWQYSADLSQREGEGVTGPTTAWLEPPGTPSVGRAYLRAYQLTGDEVLREATLETAMALVRGQLVSGGWTNRIEFDPKDRSRYAYRVEDNRGRNNRTTFDDDKSQSALRFLMETDRTFEFQNAKIHEASQYALDCFTKAQYPNGAWPQQYDEFPDPEEYPVRKASYPEEWSRSFPKKSYQGYYTLNDNTISDVIGVFLKAAEIYEEPQHRETALKGGKFFLLAQMPDPQPGWAQQYNKDMQPAWARKFEPPAITGGESQGVMQALLQLARETGDEQFLEPLPRALAYYKKSQLPDGRLARFYELKTNRPLYFTKDYELTDSSDDMPTHYAFIVGSRLDRIEREYQRLKETDPADWRPNRRERKLRMTEALRKRVETIISQMDERGAWVEEGTLRYHKEANDVKKIISPRTFRRNIITLAEFLAASR